MAMPNIFSALGTKVVVLQAADKEKVYVHKALLNGEVAAFGKCTWSCFPSTTVKNFVEYLYQGDYTPPALVASSGTPEVGPGGRSDLFWKAGWGTGNTDQERFRKPLDYKNVFLTHARLFILSRYREVLPLANMCLKRLDEAMKEAQDTTEESIFVENMRTLIRFSYSPCCNGSDDVWKELQKTVSEFLISKKGWLLEAPGSDLLSRDEQFAKDLSAAVINILIITDRCLIDKDKIIADTNKSLIDKDKILADTKKSLIDKDKILADTSEICMHAQSKCKALEAEIAQLKSPKAKKKAKKKKVSAHDTPSPSDW